MKNKSSTIINTLKGCLALAAIFMTTNSNAQSTEVIEGKLLPYESESVFPSNGPCITKEEHEAMQARVREFKIQLEAEGKLDANRTAAFGPHAFRWPLAPAKHYHQFTTYYISNYMDLNSTSSGLNANDPNHTLEDYNCGARTYDVSSNGYDHTGIDIGIGPFSWTMVDHEDVDVVAAEGGIISEKLDGEFDRTCKTPSPNVYHGNWIGVTHSDGSTTYYMHMKSGTVTSKAKGDYVSVGEYLGKVGSSGNSTGPHLHFEVADNFGSVRDPFQNGACATGLNPSLWANEEPYYNDQIVAALTLSAPWTNATCDENVSPAHAYSGTVPYCNHFNAGDVIWFTTALRDITQNQIVNIKFYNPSGTLLYNFNYTEASTVVELRTLSPNFIIAPNVTGNYKMQVTFDGVVRAHYFTVGCPGSITLSNTRNSNYGFISGGTIASTDIIASSARNVQYQAETYIQLNPGFVATNGCEFTARIDNCTVGSTRNENILSTNINQLDFNINPNPAVDEFTLSFLTMEDGTSYAISVFNALGDEVYQSMEENASLELKIKTANLMNGVYFIKVTAKNSAGDIASSTKKLIVSH